jgi:hypothetical protein
MDEWTALVVSLFAAQNGLQFVAAGSDRTLSSPGGLQIPGPGKVIDRLLDAPELGQNIC